VAWEFRFLLPLPSLRHFDFLIRTDGKTGKHFLTVLPGTADKGIRFSLSGLRPPAQ
jgi:hypothetical protein